MKPNLLNADPASMIALLKQRRLQYCELYTFVFRDGNRDYFTDLDIDINLSGITYKSGSLKIEGMKLKLSVGLQVDEQDIKLSGYPLDTLGGAAWLPAIESGLLDRGYLIRDRAFWAATTGNIFTDFTAPPVAVIRLFYRLISTITKGGQTNVQMKVKSLLHLLDLDMPKNFYTPSCLWQLFSGTGTADQCTLDANNYIQSGAVDNPLDGSKIAVQGGVRFPLGGDGRANYAQGRIVFTSGVNSNLELLIGFNDSTFLDLAYPLDEVPAFGDTFTYLVGCWHDPTACTLKFNNFINYRGFDKVPPVQITV